MYPRLFFIFLLASCFFILNPPALRAGFCFQCRDQATLQYYWVTGKSDSLINSRWGVRTHCDENGEKTEEYIECSEDQGFICTTPWKACGEIPMNACSCYPRLNCSACEELANSPALGMFCRTRTVANGTYTGSCTIKCNSGFTLVDGACFACSLCSNGRQCNAVQKGCENCPAGTEAPCCTTGRVANGAGSCVAKTSCNTACATYNAVTNTCTANATAGGSYNTTTCDVTCSSGYKKSGNACYLMVKQPSINFVCKD